MKTLFDDVIYNNKSFIFKYYEVNNYKDIINLNSLFISHSIDYNQKDLTAESFSFANVKELEIKKKIEKVGTPLKDWDININYGIKTGFNEAFIISTQKKEEILNNCKDSIELQKTKNILKPILRGRDVKRYQYKWNNQWLILLRGKDNIDEYPSLKKHMLEHKNKLENRSNCKHWYSIQGDLSDNTFKSLENDKIIWMELSDAQTFTIDKNNYYVNNSLYFLVGKSIKYLTSVLNSLLIKFYFYKIATSSGVGTKLWQKINIEQLPIPQISEEEQKPFVELVEEILAEKKENPNADTKDLEKQIDELVYKLYDLTEEEIKIVDNQK